MVKIIITAIVLILAGIWIMGRSDDMAAMDGVKHAMHIESTSAATAASK